jgi:murein DD-endopeptidase MepM/ murein hydrolase activator NlpD
LSPLHRIPVSHTHHQLEWNCEQSKVKKNYFLHYPSFQFSCIFGKRIPMTKQKLFFSFILILLMIIGVNSHAQTVSSDTTKNLIGPKVDTLSFAIDTSNIEEKIIILPITTDEIPFNEQYQSWNNDHVRIKKTDIKAVLASPVTINLLTQGNFIFPFKGKMISPFGYRSKSIHTGTDIKLNKGDTVRAAFDGVVRLSKRYGAYGKIVVIRHYNGLETVYGHLSKLMVNVNQKIVAGEVIGLGGRTGRASTDHLHFETRYYEEPFNSQHILDFVNFSLYDSTLIIAQNTFKMRSKPIHRKGFPAEEYEDDNQKSDSLDYLYAHNWTWPRLDTLQKDSIQTDSVKTTDIVQKGLIKQDTIVVKQKATTQSDLKDKKTSSLTGKANTHKKPFIGPLEDTLFAKKSSVNAKTNETQKNQQKIHTVAAKETLYSISKKYKISMDKLRQANRLTKDSILSIGQVLIIPKV